MLHNSGRARAVVTIGTAVVLTVLTVVVPLLDQGHVPGSLAFVGDDVPAGVIDHHHGICLQHGASVWFVGTGADAPASVQVRDQALAPAVRHNPSAAPAPLHLPRAPPAV